MKIFNRLSVIGRLALNDFKSKYAGSALGAFWAVAEPLVTVFIYRFVYSVVFGGDDVDRVPYYLWLSVGLAAWLFISDGLRGMCASFRDYSFLVKKISFNKKVIPHIRCASALITNILFSAIVIAVSLFNHITVISILKFSVMVMICYVYVFVSGKVLALLCGYYKDVYGVLCVLLNIGFWVTPIFWNIDLVSGKLRYVIELNPTALIAEGYRSTLLFGCFPETEKLIYLLFVTIITGGLSVLLEKRLLPNIADKL